MKEYNETIKYVETTQPDKVAEYINNLNQQLAEKDKEIEGLKKSIDFLSSDKVVSEEQCKQIAKEAQLKVFKENILLIQQEIRHQVCQEIREKANKRHTLYKDGSLAYVLSEEELDQIEKGEE